MVNGRVVKFDHQLVARRPGQGQAGDHQTIEYLMGQLGPEAWAEGMHPEIPETKVMENPYTYTEYGKS